MRLLAVYLYLLALPINLMGQDSVFLKEGTEIEGRVIRVTDLGVTLEHEGTSQLIETSQVFLIIYETGEVLNMTAPAAPSKAVTKDQPKKKLGRYRRDSLAVIYADGLLFQGFDFSFLRLVNPAKVGLEYSANRYFGAWNAYLWKELKLAKLIDRTWDSNRFNTEFDSSKRPEKWIFDSESGDIPIRKYLEAITGFHSSEREKQYYEVALAIFPIVFNKNLEEVQCRFIFYDPKSLDIYWAPIAYGKTGCCGMTGHWADGIYGTIKNMTKFIRAVNGKY